MNRFSRRGFTLFQLLIVLALLAILLGLLLPAIEKLRIAAARTQSANNLHQISIAMLNSEGTYQIIPPLAGGYHKDKGEGTLFFYILPFIEQDNVYNAALSGTDYSVWNNETYKVVIKTYLSSSDRSGGKEPLHDGWLARSNYAANFQVFGDRKNNTLNGGKVGLVAAMPDGTSNTIAFAERYQECGGDPCAWPYTSGTTWAPAFMYLTHARFQTLPTAERCDPTLAQGIYPGGINVALGDGSVRFLASSISPQTWWLACVPDDGNPLGADW
jgi:type II secretory pathway pseudopilin PulG